MTPGPVLRPATLSPELWDSCPSRTAQIVFWEGWLGFGEFEVPFVSTSLGQYFLWWKASRDVNDRQVFKGFNLHWTQLHTRREGGGTWSGWPEFKILPWPGEGAFELSAHPPDHRFAEIDVPDGPNRLPDHFVRLKKGAPVEEATVWRRREGFYLFPEPRDGVRLLFGEAVLKVDPAPYWMSWDVARSVREWNQGYKADRPWRPEGEGRVDYKVALAQRAAAERDFAKRLLDIAGIASLPPSKAKPGGILGGGLEFD